MLLILIALVWVAAGGCDKERTNPLDPENPGVAEDPFSLTLSMRTAGVRLDWRSIDHPSVRGHRVYRRVEDQDFDLIATVQSGHLTYFDTAAAIGHDYYYTLAAYDKEGQESMRSPVRHINTDVVPLFNEPMHFDIGTGPRSLATSDFDQDGDIDIAAALRRSDQVGILYNDGSGSFSSIANHDVTADPYTITVGDFDGDSDDDIAVACAGSDSLTFLWNRSGAFDSVTYFGFQSTSSVCAGYIDEDSRCDVLVVTTAGKGYFFTSRESGFAVVKTIHGLGPWSKAVMVDFREIGYKDVISVSQAEDPDGGHGRNTRVFHGGPYYHEISQEWLLMYTPVWLVAADFDGNDQIDFAAVTYGYPDHLLYAHGVHVFINIGNGLFADPVRYEDSLWTGGQLGRPFLYGICALDADNDGNMDLATTSELFSTVSLWKGNGDGTFEQPTSWRTGSYPYAVAAADFDNDGDSDLAVANYNSGTVSILINNTR